MTRVKICGLSRVEDIRAVNQAMPDYIGFVFAPSRRQVSLEEAVRLKQKLDRTIQVVGVFQNADLEQIQQAVRADVPDLIQLHGDEDETYVQKIRAVTGRPVIKAIAVHQRADIIALQHSAADFLLLDQGRGGTGQCFDWSLATSCRKQFFLAGGLTCANIVQAIRQVRPFAVDLSSGVETGGLKDPEKIAAVVRLVRACKAGSPHD